MRIAIVGGRGRSELSDTALVNQIVDFCIERHSNVIFIVASCDKGVGRIVKSRNLDKHRPNQYEFNMIEIQMRHYLASGELPRVEFTSHWNSLNAAIVELGDEFHILTAEFPKGVTQDLLRRVKEAGRRVALYKPSESKDGAKVPELLKE